VATASASGRTTNARARALWHFQSRRTPEAIIEAWAIRAHPGPTPDTLRGRTRRVTGPLPTAEAIASRSGVARPRAQPRPTPDSSRRATLAIFHQSWPHRGTIPSGGGCGRVRAHLAPTTRPSRTTNLADSIRSKTTGMTVNNELESDVLAGNIHSRRSASCPPDHTARPLFDPSRATRSLPPVQGASLASMAGSV